jgi:hypothetical protein
MRNVVMIVVTLIAIATARGSSSPIAVPMRISYSPMIAEPAAATEHSPLGPQLPPGTDCVSTFGSEHPACLDTEAVILPDSRPYAQARDLV